MRNHLARIVVVLATVAGFTLAIGGVANAAGVPFIFIGNSTAGGVEHQITADVILDADGHYNVSTGGGTGYDARLVSGNDTRDLGWGHAAGYDIPPGQCFDELEIGVGDQGLVCAPVNAWRLRTMSSTHAWEIFQRVG